VPGHDDRTCALRPQYLACCFPATVSHARQAVIAQRVANATAEIEAAGEPGLFDVVIVNDDIEQAQHDLVDCLKDELENFFAPGATNQQMASQPYDPTEGLTTAELLAGPARPRLKLKYQVRQPPWATPDRHPRGWHVMPPPFAAG